MNANPTPKQRFLESKDNISAHRDLIQSRPFDRAIDTSLAEYQRLLAQGPNDGNVNQALAGHYRQQGAVEFVHILKNLGEQPPPVTPRVVEQLDHKA